MEKQNVIIFCTQAFSIILFKCEVKGWLKQKIIKLFTEISKSRKNTWFFTAKNELKHLIYLLKHSLSNTKQTTFNH
jgi:hypothetical protein